MIMDIQGITIGIIVDAVSEVLRIPGSTVEPTPHVASSLGTEFIKGIAKLEDRLIILIDMDMLIEKSDGAAMLQAAGVGQKAIEE